jgi:hypothetical protein
MTFGSFDFGSGANFGAGTGFSDIGTMPDVGNVFGIDSLSKYDIPFGTDLGLPSITDSNIPQNFLDSILGGLPGGGDTKSTSPGMMMPGMGLPPLPMDLFNPERVAENARRIDIETAKQLQQLRGTLNDIAYLTGRSTPEFVADMERRYLADMDSLAQRNYALLDQLPNTFGATIAADTKQLGKSVDDYLDTYSLYNRPVRSEIENPSTVSIDPGVYDKQINEYMDRFKDATKAGGLMSYTDEESQELIRPENKYSREALATTYGSPEVEKAFMTYSRY